MVSFSSTSVVVVVVGVFFWAVIATLQNQVQGGQVRTRPRVLGQAADAFPPPNLLFSQFLALIVMCTVALSCWNQQEPHVPRKWGAFVPRAVLLFEVFTWAFTCKLNARTSNDFRWLPERKEAGGKSADVGIRTRTFSLNNSPANHPRRVKIANYQMS